MSLEDDERHWNSYRNKRRAGGSGAALNLRRDLYTIKVDGKGIHPLARCFKDNIGAVANGPARSRKGAVAIGTSRLSQPAYKFNFLNT